MSAYLRVTRRFLPALFSFFSLTATATDVDAVQAPDFVLPAIHNATGNIDFTTYEGKVVYVDFWASWCGPCRLSLPAIDTIYQELNPLGFEVIAVSVDVVAEDSVDFLKRYNVTYPVVIDSGGDVARAYAVNGMPSGYLIDQTGLIRSVHVGFSKGDEGALRREVLALLHRVALAP
jgi:peroxiredoxin